MYALMVVFLSIAIVGGVVTARAVANAPDQWVSDEAFAASFHRFSNAVLCSARADTGSYGMAKRIEVLKGTIYKGAPCLHSSHVELVPDGSIGPMKPGEFRAWATPTQVMTYTTPKSIRGTPAPIQMMARHGASRYAQMGVLGPDSKSIISPNGGVVGTIPVDIQNPAVQAQRGLVVGAPVQVVWRY